MAITSSALASSATPAGDFYTIVTGIMTTGGWTLLDTLTAAEAGNTGDASENVVVRVWGNTASIATATCFIYISTNESGTAPPRLRFRVSEKYDDTGVQPGPYYPVPGTSSSASQTPASNDSVTGTENANDLVLYQAASTTQKVGWVDVNCSPNGFAYLVGANAYEVVVSTSVVGASGYNAWFHGGVFRTDENFTNSTTMCYIGGQHVASNGRATSWDVVTNTNIGAYRVSREPSNGAIAIVGGFTHILGAVVPQRSVNVGWGAYLGTAHKWLTSMAAYQGYLHHASSTLLVSAIRSHLAKFTNIAVAGQGTVVVIMAAVIIGDTLTLNGSTYYVLGGNDIVSNTDGQDYQCTLVLAKSSGF
jgi:hypothetical protein